MSPNPTSRTRLRSLALAAAIALAGSLAAAQASAASLTDVEGTVEVGSGEPPSWRTAREGDSLAPGDRVRTGRGARAEIALGAARVRLYEDSLFRLPPDAQETPDAVDLESGSSLFDVLRRSPDHPFRVRTPEVVVSVKGTRFLVSAAPGEAAVAVYHGAVSVGDLQAEIGEVLVQEGFATLGGGDGPFVLLQHHAEDPWQSWSEGTPAPEPLGIGTPGATGNEAASEATAHEISGETSKLDRPALPPAAFDATASTADSVRALDPELDAHGLDLANPAADSLLDGRHSLDPGRALSGGGPADPVLLAPDRGREDAAGASRMLENLDPSAAGATGN